MLDGKKWLEYEDAIATVLFDTCDVVTADLSEAFVEQNDTRFDYFVSPLMRWLKNHLDRKEPLRAMEDVTALLQKLNSLEHEQMQMFAVTLQRHDWR